MAHTNTYIDPALPCSLARVAAVTGNGILDVGYQCSDSAPFFEFGSGARIYYTRVHPSKSSASCDVYQLLLGKMLRVGSGSQNKTALTFKSNTYQSSGAVNVQRLGYINKWSKFKPVYSTKKEQLTESEMVGELTGEGIYYGIKMQTDSAAMKNALHIEQITYDYTGLPRILQSGSADWARLTDFCGYDHNAQAPMKCEMATKTGENSVIALSLSYAADNAAFAFQHSVGFDTLIREVASLTRTTFEAMYPAIIVRSADGTNWWIKAIDSRGTFKTIGQYATADGLYMTANLSADLSGTDFTDGENVRISVCLVNAISGLANVTGQNIREWRHLGGNENPSFAKMIAFPGSVGKSVRFLRSESQPEHYTFTSYAATNLMSSISLSFAYTGSTTEGIVYMANVSSVSKGVDAQLLFMGGTASTVVGFSNLGLMYVKNQQYTINVLLSYTYEGKSYTLDSRSLTFTAK